MIADTSLIIDLLRGEENSAKKLKQLEKENKAYSLATPTIYELWIGISRSKISEKEKLLDIIESQTIHSLDKESTINAGKIQRDLIEKGERIGHIDALIAGIAQKNTGKILTDNTSEFQRVNKLDTIDYK